MAFEYIDKKLYVTQGAQKLLVEDLTTKSDEAFYLYDLDGIVKRYQQFVESLSGIDKTSIHYAMKANSHPVLLQALATQGAGADVVSGGEIDLALKGEIPAEKIVFSGVGKSRAEIEKAIKLGLKQINVESPAELNRIADVAKNLNKTANVALRLNPDVNPETHPYIKTGFRENKFGMDAELIPELIEILKLNKEFVNLHGLTIHIGSQILDIEPFAQAVKKTLTLYSELKKSGWPVKTIDVGGGLGMDYHNLDDKQDLINIENYGQELTKLFTDIDAEILFEPGRIIVGRFGLLCTRVEYIKETPYKKIAIVNTGMHHLMRPALYQAFHNIIAVTQTNKDRKVYDIVGPICESADVLGHDRVLPELGENDWLAVTDTGAYGFVMANTYNAHALPKEYIVSEGKIL